MYACMIEGAILLYIKSASSGFLLPDFWPYRANKRVKKWAAHFLAPYPASSTSVSEIGLNNSSADNWHQSPSICKWELQSSNLIVKKKDFIMFLTTIWSS
eukprot:NODE_393_length_9450_cov_0.506791.p8 type:complete len:100 gc:universal NODE_393_length_9450_cov_0.506791:5618-5319(-)